MMYPNQVPARTREIDGYVAAAILAAGERGFQPRFALRSPSVGCKIPVRAHRKNEFEPIATWFNALNRAVGESAKVGTSRCDVPARVPAPKAFGAGGGGTI